MIYRLISSHVHQTIDKWLKQHFREKGQDVPPYEVNEATIDHLYRLYEDIQASEAEGQAQIDTLRLGEHEFRAEGVIIIGSFLLLSSTHVLADRMDELLKAINVAPDGLSRSGVANVGFITSLASVLDLKDTELSR